MTDGVATLATPSHSRLESALCQPMALCYCIPGYLDAGPTMLVAVDSFYRPGKQMGAPAHWAAMSGGSAE